MKFAKIQRVPSAELDAADIARRAARVDAAFPGEPGSHNALLASQLKETARFSDIPLMPRAHYSITMEWSGIERHLARCAEHPGEEVILDPEYQRGHVWTPGQQTAYVEYVLMGGESAKDLLFNCPGFTGGNGGKYGPYEIVDGLQRLSAARAFMRGDIRAFGHFRSEYTDRPRMHVAFNWRVMELPTRAEVLKAYLAFNSGGVVHSREEIERVKALLAKETAK